METAIRSNAIRHGLGGAKAVRPAVNLEDKMEVGLLATNAISSLVSVTTAAQAGNDVLFWVSIIVSAVTMLSNAALAIYRKWRDRDKPVDNSDNVTPTDGSGTDDDGGNDDGVQ